MRNDFSTRVNFVPIVTAIAATKRQKNLTNDSLNYKSKQRHRDETLRDPAAIHSAANDLTPTLDGLVDTILGKVKATEVVEKIFNSKTSVSNTIVKKYDTNFCSDYYKSNNNLLCSLNIYYSYSVMGKRKYIILLKADKSLNFPSYVLYADLSKPIRSIDIGRLHNINPSLSYNLPKTEIGEGIYRELPEFALRLARFYIIINKNRHEKLKKSDTFPKKNPEFVLFLIAIVGDEAPIAGTTFLISFINFAKRVASSTENFLLFGGNGKDNGSIVQLFVEKLTLDLIFISTNLKGRHEEVPLLGKYIDLARWEPPYLKNNTVKEMLMKVLRIVLSETNLSTEIKLFKKYQPVKFFLDL